jgi:hypothetical protein
MWKFWDIGAKFLEKRKLEIVITMDILRITTGPRLH